MTDTTLVPVTTTTTDLATIRTPKTGKMLQDFDVPEKFLTEHAELVAMVLRSESMNDGERQYWFSLTEVMNAEQVEKLRGILTREREKLTAIEEKYGPSKPTLTDAEVVERNIEMQAERAQQQAELREKEEAANAKEGNDEDILSELDNL
jgi:hypothetical protein